MLFKTQRSPIFYFYREGLTIVSRLVLNLLHSPALNFMQDSSTNIPVSIQALRWLALGTWQNTSSTTASPCAHVLARIQASCWLAQGPQI